MNIDFVITWVDGNDPEWRKEKDKYSVNRLSDANKLRYRDWDNLKYWFRGVETFAPWVNKIFFVTWGHYPDWLNIDNPKLNIVKHEDFIPNEYLPTFSSIAIDMNFHRISELSEYFVYFNDDMFLTLPTKPSDFFVDGLPCDAAVENALYFGADLNQSKAEINMGKLFLAPALDMLVINKHFNKKEVMRNNRTKWMSYKYGLAVLRTLLLQPWRHFTGFMSYHLPYSYLKSTYEEVWRLEHGILDESCKAKFRTVVGINHWVFSYWQLAKGSFYPRNPKVGKLFGLYNEQNRNKEAIEAVKYQKYKMVCLNDEVTDSNFEHVRDALNQEFERILPKKSSFEL